MSVALVFRFFLKVKGLCARTQTNAFVMWPSTCCYFNCAKSFMHSSDNVRHNAEIILCSDTCLVRSTLQVQNAADVIQAKETRTDPLLLVHCILVSHQVHIEILDKGVVAARLVTDHSQQLKQGLHPVPVVADVVQVALGNAASLQQLVALQVLLLCNPEKEHPLNAIFSWIAGPLSSCNDKVMHCTCF